MKPNIKVISFIFLMFSIVFVAFFVASDNLVSQGFFEDEKTDSEFDVLKDLFTSTGGGGSNPLSLGRKDIKFKANEEGNYIDLLVRKRENINSILIIYVVSEFIEGKKFSVDYGLRSLEYNTINGDEIRLLNNVELGKEQNLYFLVDSTPEKDSEFGEAFRVRIPTYTQYGYTKENFGLVRVGEGTFLKIRAFDRPYADYNGEYRDNMFEVSTVESIAPEKARSGKPVITKDLFPNNGKKLLNEPDGEYIVQYIRYTDDSKFFKELLYREYLVGSADEQNKYRTMPFKIEDEPGDGHAVLLASIYQDGYKLVRAKVYFKMGKEARSIQISARDGDGNMPNEEDTIIIDVNRIDDEDLDGYQIDDLPGDIQ